MTYQHLVLAQFLINKETQDTAVKIFKEYRETPISDMNKWSEFPI